MKNRLISLGLNYKKEIILLIIVPLISILLSALIYLVLKNNLFAMMMLISGFSYIIYFFFKINKLKVKKLEEKTNSFIDYFSYFKIYIFNGENIYSAFNKTISFATDNIKLMVEKLLNDINEDKTIKPYITFSKNFNDQTIEQIMISIFQMVDNGNDENYLNQFTKIFEDFKKRNKLVQEEKRINRFDTLLNSSLIGSGVVMLILVFGIVNLVGEIL